MTIAPVLDPDALGRLGEQLGDDDVLCGFLRRYVSLLDQRIERLEHAVSSGDHDGWMDAVLSLKSSSALAGAQALSTMAARLQERAGHPESRSWRRWCQAGCPETLRILRELAAETARQIRVFLQQLGAPARPGGRGPGSLS